MSLTWFRKIRWRIKKTYSRCVKSTVLMWFHFISLISRARESFFKGNSSCFCIFSIFKFKYLISYTCNERKWMDKRCMHQWFLFTSWCVSEITFWSFKNCGGQLFFRNIKHFPLNTFCNNNFDEITLLNVSQQRDLPLCTIRKKGTRLVPRKFVFWNLRHSLSATTLNGLEG